MKKKIKLLLVILLVCIFAVTPVMAYDVPDGLGISHNYDWNMFYAPDEFGDATDTLIMLNQTEGKSVSASDSDDMFSFLRASETVKVYTVFMPDGGMGFIIQDEDGHDIVPSGSSYSLTYRINDNAEENYGSYYRRNYEIDLKYYESPGIFAAVPSTLKEFIGSEFLSELMAGRDAKCIINFGGNNYSFTVSGNGFRECLTESYYDHSADIYVNYADRTFYGYDGVTSKGEYIFNSLKEINECSGSLALMINMHFYYYEDLLENGADKETCRDEAYEKAEDAFLTATLIQKIVKEQEIDTDVDMSEFPDNMAGNDYSEWLKEVWKYEQLLPDVYEYLEEHNTVNEAEYAEETEAETEEALEEILTEIVAEIETTVEETEEETIAEETVAETEAEEETVMILRINDSIIPVIWEENNAVAELEAQAAEETITVVMSMYGGWEQVGSLGRTYTKNDTQITAENGDIMLYSGNQIVLFYGENSWAYTRLGKMDLTEDEVTEILSSGDVTLTISCE